MKLIILLGVLAAALFLGACLIGTPSPASTKTPEIAETVAPGAATGAVGATCAPAQAAAAGVARQYSRQPSMGVDANVKYTAVIQTNCGAITLELFPAQAPLTVNNFVFLAREGFYNGVTFHRVIPNFMIQGGDPSGTGAGGPGYSFRDEIVPSLKFDRPGILAMANAGPNTNGSQFFITTAQTSYLDGRHTIFGRVVSGQEVAVAISGLQTDARDRPLQPVVIRSIEINSSGGG